VHVLDTVSIRGVDVPRCIELVHTYVIERVPRKFGIFIVQALANARGQSATKRNLTVRLFRGCHSLSYQRLGFGGTTNPDTLILSKAEPRYAMETKQ
jgi:hypothetical protein